MSAEALTYQTARSQLHYDPDGTLHIDVPAPGWTKILQNRSVTSLVVGTFCAAVGLFAPALMVFYASHSSALALCALVLNTVVVLTLVAILAHQAGIRTHVTVTPSHVVVETFSGAGPIGKRYARDEIEVLAACHRFFGQVRSTGLCIQRKRYDTADYYLASCTQAELDAYAAAIRATLQFAAAEASGTTR